MNQSAIDLAEAITREQYANGEIGLKEFEGRMEMILRGDPAAFQQTSYREVWALGNPRPQSLAVRWEWPE